MGPEWERQQTNQSLACVVYGDCIFDVVEKGAKVLEKKWKRIAKPWNRLIDKAVRGRFFGLGSPTVDRRWLAWLIYQPVKRWPSQLTKEEVQILELVVAVSAYHPDYSEKVDRKSGITSDPERLESSEDSLAAMRQYAQLVKAQIAMPMWRAYENISKDVAQDIIPLCKTVYGESCSESEAKNMFKGDLQRAWKMRTLGVGPPTYTTFPKFIAWIAA